MAMAKTPVAKKKTKAAPRPAPKAKSKPTRTTKPAVQKGGVVFKDRGFRLAVINCLLEDHFQDAIDAAEAKAEEVEDYKTDPVIEAAVNGFVITPEMLAEVTSLSPDGGDEIYDALVPVWDGEDDRFDIGSLEDVALLPNLEKVSLYAMVKKGIDLGPLANAPKLKSVRVSLPKSWTTGRGVLALLRKRGVEVEDRG